MRIAALAALLIALPAAFACEEEEHAAAPIVHIEKRDRKITIKTSSLGPLYTVRAKTGEVLAEDLSEQELLAHSPELHQLVKSAIATEGYLDATNRLDDQSPTRKR